MINQRFITYINWLPHGYVQLLSNQRFNTYIWSSDNKVSCESHVRIKALLFKPGRKTFVQPKIVFVRKMDYSYSIVQLPKVQLSILFGLEISFL